LSFIHSRGEGKKCAGEGKKGVCSGGGENWKFCSEAGEKIGALKVLVGKQKQRCLERTWGGGRMERHEVVRKIGAGRGRLRGPNRKGNWTLMRKKKEKKEGGKKVSKKGGCGIKEE